MTRNATITIRVLSATFLALTAQSLLLIPHWQTELMRGMPPLAGTVLGIVSFFASIWLCAIALLDYNEARALPIHLLAELLLGIYIFLYARAGLYLESGMLGVLAAGYLAAAWRPAAAEGWDRGNAFVVLTACANVLLGAALLFAPTLFSDLHYRPLRDEQLGFGLFFLGSGIYTLLRLPGAGKDGLRPHRHLPALPWLGYCLAFLFPPRPAHIIPALLFVSAAPISDRIPWQKVFLAKPNLFGKRLFWLFAGAVFISLLVLAGLLYLSDGGRTAATPQFGSREIAFLFFLGQVCAAGFGVMKGNVAANRLVAQLLGIGSETAEAADPKGQASPGSLNLTRLLKPFSVSQREMRERLRAQDLKLRGQEEQLSAEKRRNSQLLLLHELSRQLESQLDQPVAAQLAVNTVERALNCSLAAVFLNDSEHRELSVLAVAGNQLAAVPPGYRQSIQRGVLGRATRLRKTQVVPDTRSDPDHFNLENLISMSEVCVPLIHHGHLKGILLVDNDRCEAFSNSDVEIVEAVGAELIRAWERSGYRQRLTDLIQAGISLSTLLDPQTSIQQIAVISRETLEAQFTFVTLLDQDGNFTRTAHSGVAPKLLACLVDNPLENAFLQTTLNASQAFRVRDVRKYLQATRLVLDTPSLRSMLAIPIYLHRLSIGVILAFGKRGELFFSENDESLASLLSSQAAAGIESAWLYQELRNTLGTTTLLYQLSSSVIQAEKIDQAAKMVAETAFRLANATAVGIVLFTPENKMEAEIMVDASGAHSGAQHPKDLIQQARKAGQSIFISPDQTSARICYPLQTPARNYGALWLEIPESRWFTSRYSSNLQALANQAAVALERAILLVESRRQAKALEAAYQEMEATYDRTLAALTSALDARDRETQGHSQRVGILARRLGRAVGLSDQQLKILERGAILHDIGKIGIGDAILHKPGPLTEDEWRIMRMHPDIGARIVSGIPFLEDTLPIIRYHQERWDGSGYPVGLRKSDIPTLARVFAVADAFDALTSTRPYRQKNSTEQTVAYLHEQSGVLFDPQIIKAFEKLYQAGELDDLIEST